jgi:hypothetical protein
MIKMILMKDIAVFFSVDHTNTESSLVSAVLSEQAADGEHFEKPRPVRACLVARYHVGKHGQNQPTWVQS